MNKEIIDQQILIKEQIIAAIDNNLIKQVTFENQMIIIKLLNDPYQNNIPTLKSFIE